MASDVLTSISMQGDGDAVGEEDDAGAGDVNVAHPSANRAPVGVDPPSAARTVTASFPGVNSGVNVGDARRRYADVVVEACRQRTLVEATLLNKMYRWPAVTSAPWRGAQSEHLHSTFFSTACFPHFPSARGNPTFPTESETR